jgi:hypothetical protein
MTHVTPEALAGYLDHDLPSEERSQVGAASGLMR